MKRYLFSSLLLMFTLGMSTAQPLNKITTPVMLETAERAMEEYNYYKALEWYERAYETTEDPSLLVKIGDLNLALRDYKKAERAYKKLYRKEGPDIHDRRFSYARTLKMNGKYQEAIDALDVFLGETANHPYSDLAQAEKKGAVYAMAAVQDEKMTISNAGKNINSKSSEYSPYLQKKGQELYFVSFGENEIVELDQSNRNSFGAKILVSQKEGDSWGTAKVLDKNINRPGYYNSNLTFSPDGETIFFARQLLMEGNKLKESKLYSSSRNGEGWTAAQEVVGVNGDFLVKSPSMGELFGRKVLFFVSNKAGGYGGYDIYYANSNGGNTFEEPINLGASINTMGDEETPFYQDGNLYFSSTGLPGMGGLDVFKAAWNGSAWSVPVNMGPGYNSSADDLSFMLDEGGANGLLASNRIDSGSRSLKSKTCCNDIYTISIDQIKVDLLASALDSKTQKALQGAVVQLYVVEKEQPTLLSSQEVSTDAPLAFPLEFGKAFKLVAEREGYEPASIAFNTVGMGESLTIEKVLNLVAIPPPPPEKEYVTITREEPFTLENIYYDYNSAAIRQDAEVDLQFLLDLLNKYPSMVIELSSHTDSRGKAAYNLALSQRRADSARQWLLNKGITPERVVAKGYGKSSPKTINDKLASKYSFLSFGNVLTDDLVGALGSKDLQEIAHQINRRTEVQIIDGPTSIKIEERKEVKK